MNATSKSLTLKEKVLSNIWNQLQYQSTEELMSKLKQIIDPADERQEEILKEVERRLQYAEDNGVTEG